MVGIKIIKILTDDSSKKLTEKMNKVKSKILEYSCIRANIATYKKDHEFEIPFAGNKAFASILIHGVRKQQIVMPRAPDKIVPRYRRYTGIIKFIIPTAVESRRHPYACHAFARVLAYYLAVGNPF